MEEKKRQRYQRLYEQLKGHLQVTDDPVARMATIVALLHHKADSYFWTGFYQLIDGELIVGPYQGFLACQKLKKDTGVCWDAVNRGCSIIVPNVDEFPGHIACDSRSKSEITVPCIDDNDQVYAVLDVDSDKINSFDEIDAEGLERIVSLL